MPRAPLRSPALCADTLRALARGVAVLACALLGAAPVAAQGVRAPAPDTFRIVNTASLGYSGLDGVSGTAVSTAEVVMEQLAGVALEPSRQAVVNPGTRVVMAHRVTNTGTGRDAFRLQASAPAGWGVALWLDVDGDGALGARDVQVTGPVLLTQGQAQGLLAVVQVPADAADRAQVSIDVTATSAMNAAAAMGVSDVLTVHRTVAALVLGKTVDRPQATTGDTLTYTLAWANHGDGPTGEATLLTDALPSGIRFVPGSLALNGAAQTDSADADAGSIARDAGGQETVRVRLGAVAAGDSGRVRFRATLSAGTPAGALANVATVAWDSTSVSSPTAVTAVKYPTLMVGKERISADTVTVGGEIAFKLTYANLSTDVSVVDAVLVDSLPAILGYVSADVPAEVEGQVLRWHLGNLAPGAGGTITVRTRAGMPSGGPVASVINRVVARGANAEAVSAAASALRITAFQGNELRIAKASGVLEAGAGDAVPYTITLRNTGAAALHDLVVSDLLPDGVRVVDGSLSGADSMRVTGRDLRIWWSGALAGGQERAVRYAVLVVTPPRGGTLANRAWAVAESGVVRSDTATALVRSRRGFAMQQRTVVGKVFMDLNDNGRQDAGEPGAAGLDVWSADGQVVKTDREGRFSLADVQPGTLLLRLDTLGIPAGFTPGGRERDQHVVRMDGWTLPEATFRLVPRPGYVPPAAPPAAATTTAPASTTPVATVPVDAPAPMVEAAPVPGLAMLPSLPVRRDRVVVDSTASTETGSTETAGDKLPAELASCPIGGPTAGAGLSFSLVAPQLADAAPARRETTATRGPSAGAPAIASPPRTATAPAGPTAIVAAAPKQPATGIALPATLPADSAAGPRVAPLRSAAEREAEVRGELLTGPSVRIFAPMDGAVVGTNRLYVGVRGEPGMEVKVFDGARQVGEATLRPDGVMDFVGVEVAPGPHHVRVWMKNSWGTERWDSVAVHRSGDAVRLERVAGDVPVMHADGRDTTRVAARVLDRWNVPLADRPKVTVLARGATPAGSDSDPSSVGFQVAAGADGTVSIPVVAGHDVGPGEVALEMGKVHEKLPFRVYPSTRSLFAAGIGQVGVGAAPESFGAVTVRGAVGHETSLSVSYDSRRSSSQDEFFGRGYDPLDESRYPTLGDGSERRVLSAATQNLTARLERGYDWLELGDVNTEGFGGGAQLGGYQRSLTGLGGRVATGAVVWRGFASMTDQALVQKQLRGDGTSGPYKLGGQIRAGTDRVGIEVRARDNAARVIGRTELQRFVDYQVDYTTGEILLERPVPSADAEGNPVYVVATVERRSGGQAQLVGGLRMEVDARRWLGAARLDSLGVGVYGVRDAAENGGVNVRRGLMGADARVRKNGMELGGEVLRSASGDSAALATHADASWTATRDRARLEAEFMHVGQGFSGSADPRLSSGLQELRLAGEMKVAEGSSLRLSHERQHFGQYGVDRHNTRLALQQSLWGRSMTAEGGMATDVQADATSSAAVGKVTFSPMSRVDVWMQGTRQLDQTTTASAATTVAARPNEVSAGIALRVLPRTRLEASHRWVSIGGDSARSYQITSFNARTQAVLGGQVYGGLERSDDSRAGHYLALGWDQHLQIAGGWALSSMLERRFGVSQAALADPTRALPFPQAEPDRWSGGLGLDWVPADGRPRFSAHGEMHDGADTRGHRIDVAGDAPFGASVALLGRSEWLQDYHLTGNGLEMSRRDRSLVGLALRPVGSTTVNALAKMEWRRTLNPIGTAGVLGAAGEDRRLIGSTDLVWTPAEGTEVAARYALRWTLADPSLPGVAQLGARAQYAGLRTSRDVRGPLQARLDTRLLVVGSGYGQEWSAAPSLVMRVGRQLELEGGYRFGGLVDPDFGAGGTGLFATLGFHFSEGTLTNAAAFWRERIAH